MSGFGLYETLRLVLPGSLAVAVFSIMLRLAGGPKGGPFGDLVGDLKGPTFAAAALAAGFLLYVLDLPVRARIQRGDPDKNIDLPTTALEKILAGTKHADKSFSLYFLLTDAHLPAEAHKRVYFFGGLHRVYVDARLLTAAAVGIGGPLALAVTEGGRRGWSWTHCFAALTVVLAVLACGAVGEVKHASDSMARRARNEPDKDVAELRRTYRGSTRVRLRDLRGVLVTQLALGVLAMLLTNLGNTPGRIIGLVAAAAAVLLWGMVEMGPPEKATPPRVGIRSPILRRLRVPDAEAAQYVPLQRTLSDAALFLPALLGAGLAASRHDRPALMVLLWGGLALPATVIMAARKHEVRLLGSFRDQVTWLQLNEAKIKEIGNNGYKEHDGDAWS